MKKNKETEKKEELNNADLEIIKQKDLKENACMIIDENVV